MNRINEKGYGVYVANCTMQKQQFSYRTSVGAKIIHVEIPIGGQQKLPGELTNGEIAYIEHQHVKYGLINADNIDRAKPFFGTVLSIGAPIDVQSIRRGISHNTQVLKDRGAELRKEAAVAAGQELDKRLPPDMTTDHVQIELEEVPQKGEDQELNERITVTKDENEARDGNHRSRRR